MRSRILELWRDLRSSYWFIPTLMAIGAVILAMTTLEVDRRWGTRLPVPWIALDPDSARAFLTTVAGSMITVAGVVFSITMVALTLASSQFGPRLLTNFMRDRGNQVVLGTFVATFLYCMLVLRVLELGEGADAVPEVSLGTALLLAVGSLAVLIYFIHHAAVSIQVSTLTSELGRDLERALEHLQEQAGTGAGDGWSEGDAQRRRRVVEEGREVGARESGYVDQVDADGLLKLCEKHDLVAVVVQKPGRFVVAGAPLLRVLPAAAAAAGEGGAGGSRDGGSPAGERSDDLDDDLGDDLLGELRDACPLSPKRRPGDVEYVLAQLVELAVRALSPGINDPFTAINCIDLLGASLARFAEEPPPPPRRRGDDGALRVVLPALTLKDVLGAAFNQVRQYGRGSAAVTLRLLERLADLASRTTFGEDREAVLEHAAMVRRSGLEALPEPNDRADVEQRYRWILEAAGREPGEGPEETAPAEEVEGGGTPEQEDLPVDTPHERGAGGAAAEGSGRKRGAAGEDGEGGEGGDGEEDRERTGSALAGRRAPDPGSS